MRRALASIMRDDCPPVGRFWSSVLGGVHLPKVRGLTATIRVVVVFTVVEVPVVKRTSFVQEVVEPRVVDKRHLVKLHRVSRLNVVWGVAGQICQLPSVLSKRHPGEPVKAVSDLYNRVGRHEAGDSEILQRDACEHRARFVVVPRWAPEVCFEEPALTIGMAQVFHSILFPIRFRIPFIPVSL